MQLARVLALEVANDGIRVNTVHPNGVFDTAIWTDEVLQARASHYGISVEEYRKNNLLQREVSQWMWQRCLSGDGQRIPMHDRRTGSHRWWKRPVL